MSDDGTPQDALDGGRTAPHDAPGREVAISLRAVNREFRRPRTSLTRPPAVVHAVRDVSLDILAGERFGLVGESGSGKSTLLRMISGLDRPTSGEVLIEGQPIHDRSPRQLGWLRRRLQLVFQDPMSSLDPRMRIREIIAEPLVAQGIPRGSRVDELLERVGLSTDAARRFPHQFSGGQRQRISVARALAPDPHILVADEPVSALDVSVRAQVLNLIDEVVEGFDLTLVFVSHDLSVVRHVCDRIAVMRAGEIVEVGPTEQVYTDPQHPYTRQLLASVPRLSEALAGRSAAELAARTRAALVAEGATDEDSAQRLAEEGARADGGHAATEDHARDQHRHQPGEPDTGGTSDRADR
ncbi:ATP-binding cassette domain-containing protein [Ornithinimicrobium sp. F0845]|uniref:ATP-binding cassette domain-containing protein n=1 Tax=Ornithinimicrobium sp. F0845 TaxID=2926412 RepID=UPI001FF1D5B4|nr:ATP-binding cassette domain-containing protein [Ornithinimicrobium sp. F0845]MCK0112074.1 ATP-binding cassette domain-containing protein [Ornithinimicrobium sp. F0845]